MSMSPFTPAPVERMTYSTFEDYTVTDTDPLRIQRDGDSVELPITPDTLVDPALMVPGDRVRVENADGRLIIHGIAFIVDAS